MFICKTGKIQKGGQKMFEILLRKVLWKDCNEEELEVFMLLKHKIKISFISVFLLTILLMVPIFLIYELCDITARNILNTIYIIFMIFLIIFRKRLIELMFIVDNIVYFFVYTIKGNAISKEDFATIKRENKYLYKEIMRQECIGYCYYYCFHILKSLKKGKIYFIAHRNMEKDINKKYTIHVLYVNNNWSLDTCSVKQYPLDVLMKTLKGKTYRSFSYEELADKTYEQFKNEQFPALKKWCEENDCFQAWRKD